jgi:hypothetical protein
MIPLHFCFPLDKSIYVLHRRRVAVVDSQYTLHSSTIDVLAVMSVEWKEAPTVKGIGQTWYSSD